MGTQIETKGEIRTLFREVATLTASLQRETQRRSAIASRAKEQEIELAAAQQKLRQVQYANKRLEEEIALLKSEGGVSERVPPAHTAAATIAPSPEPAPQPSQPQPTGDVGHAVHELEAIVPRYRSAIAALQSRVSLLQSQHAAVAKERDQLQGEATTWREAAEQHKAAFIEASAKLHTQEAAALASASSAAARLEQAGSSAASWRRSCQQAEAAAAEARAAAETAQRELLVQKKLVATQVETIARLEQTVREQQEDIIAALDLVCHRSPAPPQNARPVETSSPEMLLVGEKARNVPARQEATASASWVDGLDNGEDWSIPAGSTAAKESQGTLEKGAQRREALAPSPVKQKLEARSGGGAGGMAQLAADIAALQSALKDIL